MFNGYRDILKAMIDRDIDLFLSTLDKFKTFPGVNSQGAILLDVLRSEAREKLMGNENNHEMIDCVILETTTVLISLDNSIEQYSKIKSIGAVGCKLFTEEPVGKKNSVNIYPSIITHLKQHLPKGENFSKDEVIIILSARWKALFNKTLSPGSVKLYARAYVDHMMEQGDIILVNTNNVFLYNADNNYKLVSPGHNKSDKQEPVGPVKKTKETKPEQPKEEKTKNSDKQPTHKETSEKSEDKSVVGIPQFPKISKVHVKTSPPKSNSVSKFKEQFKQSTVGTPLQRYIFKWALQNDTDIVDTSDMHATPINHYLNNVSQEGLRDSLVVLELAKKAEEISEDIFRLDFERFLNNGK